MTTTRKATEPGAERGGARPRVARMVALLGGGALGALALLASVTGAVPSEISGGLAEREALAAGGDGGSTYVSAAQRGEVVPPDIEDIEQMCALLTSCSGLPLPPQLIPKDFGSCMTKMASDMSRASSVFYSLTIRECGLTASSCESLRSCVLHNMSKDICKGYSVASGKSAPDPVGRCVYDEKSGRDYAFTCFNENVLSARDCTRGNETCQVYTPRDCGKADCSAQARCILGSCGDVKEGAAPSCSKSKTHVVHCERGKLVSIDCQAFGLSCVEGPDGKAGCATNAKTCTGTAKHCEGETSVGCYNGHEVRVDCKKAGLVCNSTGPGTAIGDCFAPKSNASCDPSDAPKCTGGKNEKISYCFAGKPRSYDCSTFFGKCEAKGGSARCTPK